MKTEKGCFSSQGSSWTPETMRRGERPPQILPTALGRTGPHPQLDLGLPASRTMFY